MVLRNRVPFAYNTKLHILRSIIIMCSYSYRLVKHWNSKNFCCETNSQNTHSWMYQFLCISHLLCVITSVELNKRILFLTETTMLYLPEMKILFFLLCRFMKIEIDEHAISNWRWLLWIHSFQFMCFSICRIAWIHSELVFKAIPNVMLSMKKAFDGLWK